jgi:hypothetical protein
MPRAPGLLRYRARHDSSPVFFVEAPGTPVFAVPRPGGAGESTPAKCRGGGAPRGASGILRCRAPFRKRGRLSALHGGDFCPRVRASWFPPRFHLGLSASSAHRLVAPWSVRNSGTVPVQQAPCRAAVVPPGRVPGPPECEVTSLARGRRILLHHRDVSRRRPQPSRTTGLYSNIRIKVKLSAALGRMKNDGC